MSAKNELDFEEFRSRLHRSPKRPSLFGTNMIWAETCLWISKDGFRCERPYTRDVAPLIEHLLLHQDAQGPATFSPALRKAAFCAVHTSTIEPFGGKFADRPSMLTKSADSQATGITSTQPNTTSSPYETEVPAPGLDSQPPSKPNISQEQDENDGTKAKADAPSEVDFSKPCPPDGPAPIFTADHCASIMATKAATPPHGTTRPIKIPKSVASKHQKHSSQQVADTNAEGGHQVTPSQKDAPSIQHTWTTECFPMSGHSEKCRASCKIFAFQDPRSLLTHEKTKDANRSDFVMPLFTAVKTGEGGKDLSTIDNKRLCTKVPTAATKGPLATRRKIVVRLPPTAADSLTHRTDDRDEPPQFSHPVSEPEQAESTGDHHLETADQAIALKNIVSSIAVHGKEDQVEVQLRAPDNGRDESELQLNAPPVVMNETALEVMTWTEDGTHINSNIPQEGCGFFDAMKAALSKRVLNHLILFRWQLAYALTFGVVAPYMPRALSTAVWCIFLPMFVSDLRSWSSAE